MRALNGKKRSAEAKKLIHFLQNELKVKKIRFPESSGIGVKPISKEAHREASEKGD